MFFTESGQLFKDHEANYTYTIWGSSQPGGCSSPAEDQQPTLGTSSSTNRAYSCWSHLPWGAMESAEAIPLPGDLQLLQSLHLQLPGQTLEPTGPGAAASTPPLLQLASQRPRPWGPTACLMSLGESKTEPKEQKEPRAYNWYIHAQILHKF